MSTIFLYDHLERRLFTNFTAGKRKNDRLTPQTRARGSLRPTRDTGIKSFEAKTHDCLVCLATSVAPLPIEERFVTEINEQPCTIYIDWFSITFQITMTACPIVSIPYGFTQSGPPVGNQIVGKPSGEAQPLSFARRFEES